MCDIGSSTEQFRTQEQPWIEEYIFAPARRTGGVVTHVDIKEATGVDIVGDLLDRQVVASLQGLGFNSVFCSNLLEHVLDPHLITAALTSLVPLGGLLFISCPYRFPFHPDPIDTLFRPNPQDLASLFAGTRIERQEIVRGGTYLDFIRQDPRAFATRAARSSIGSGRTRTWRSSLTHVPWLFRRFRQTCLVLERTGLRNA